MKCLALVLLSCLLATTPSSWGVIYHTGFETPEFTPTLPLDGQGGWVGLDEGYPGSIKAARVVYSPGRGNTGRCFVRCRAADLEKPYGPVLFDGNWEYPIEFDAVTNPALVRVQADVKLVGPDTGVGPGADYVSANLMARNGRARAAYYYLSSNGCVYANANYYDEITKQDVRVYYQHETPIKFGEYNRLAIILNYRTHIATFEVNNKVIGTLRFGGPGERFQSVLLECAAWDAAEVYDHTKYTAYWDNILVRARPAP